MNSQTSFLLDKERHSTWAMLPTVPSYPTCLQPPWLWGMFCVGCWDSPRLQRYQPPPAARGPGEKPEFTVVTIRGKQEHKPQSPPWVVCSAAIKQSNEFSVREPEVQPRCRFFTCWGREETDPEEFSHVGQAFPFLPSINREAGKITQLLAPAATGRCYIKTR